MITEQDLQAAIAECQGQRNPNANTCLKLASYYIIQDKMFKENKEEQGHAQVKKSAPLTPTYSYSADPDRIEYLSNTEFSEAIFGRSVNEVLPIIDELMTVIQAINPKLYNGVMSKILS